MSLPARITDFQPLATILSSEVDSEFNNLVNVLNGTDQTKSIRIRSNDGSLAVARFDQLAAAANILELFRAGVLASRIDNVGDVYIEHNNPLLRFIHGANHCSFQNNNGNFQIYNTVAQGIMNWDLPTRVVNFSEQPTMPHIRTKWAVTFCYPDLSSIPVAGNFDDAPGALIPTTGTNFVATHIFYKVASGVNSGGTIVVMRKQPFANQVQTDLGAFNINPAAGTVIGVGSEQAITPHTFSANDFIYPIVSAQAAGLFKQVWVGVRGYQVPLNP